ncbi:hypothetical protein CAPTEDRAFT_213595 [Capitella teleta]|uniref:SPRY domain-containing protein n=1 Tax=Capitella teleta TaxID=283909 RepID=R7VCM2_CAPTE|nr:hypothetical protein CAPTEDRAFT_213595 [Capitella teleta]|eukprot:ELU16379.1 hypothetical protein CAPTEDRAFT_213595 [Capitella teleta]
MRFLTKLPHVQCLLRGSANVIIFEEGAPRQVDVACIIIVKTSDFRATVAVDQCFSAPGKHSFEVFMKDKKVKTAVGVLNEGKTTEYMRDDPIPENHVSFGGAGWIHPKEIAAGGKYTEGDRVKVEIDFTSQKIKFYVNGKFVGEDDWKESSAYPAISCDGGPWKNILMKFEHKMNTGIKMSPKGQKPDEPKGQKPDEPKGQKPDEPKGQKPDEPKRAEAR